MKKEKAPIVDCIGLDEIGIIRPQMEDIKEKMSKRIDTAVVLFDRNPSSELLENSTMLYEFKTASNVTNQYIYDDKIILAYSPLGGPASGALIEELVELGIKKVISSGSSGLLGDFNSESFLLVSKAIRDEGMSYHYLEPSMYVETDKKLNKILREGFERRKLEINEGITWTTDAFYRETPTKIKNRKEQGAIAVEMECASMASVCKYHGIQFSQILYFSDVFNQVGWQGFKSKEKRISAKDIINKTIIDIVLEL